MMGIWLLLMSSVLVFHSKGGSEVTNALYSLIFVLFVNLVVACTYVTIYEYVRSVLKLRGLMYVYVLAVLLFMTEQSREQVSGVIVVNALS
jgi:hypothetical protein